MSSRLALALVLVLVAMGGQEYGTSVVRSDIGSGAADSWASVARGLPYRGFAALAEAAPDVEIVGARDVPVSSVPHPVSAFLRGYRAFQGEPAWEARFLNVIECESGWHWHRGDSYHVSVAQFHPESWATASAATGLTDPENLYHVGANVAVWSNEVGPEPPGGWSCWYRRNGDER